MNKRAAILCNDMELKDYLSIGKTYKKVIFGAGLLGTVIALVASSMLSQGYEGEISFIIRNTNTQETTEFQYDAYYALEASDRITRMTEQYVKQEGLDVATKRLGNQYLVVSYTDKSLEELETKTQRLRERIPSFVSSLAPAPEQKFEAVAQEVKEQERQARWTQNILAGLIAGLFVGIMLALLDYYFKHEM